MANPFLKFNTYSNIFCFPEWAIKLINKNAFNFVYNKIYWWTYCCSCTDLTEKYIIHIWCKVLIKGQQPLLDKEMFALHEIYHLKQKFFFIYPGCNNHVSLFNYIWSLRRCLIFWGAFMFTGSLNEASYFSVFMLILSILPLTSFPCKIFLISNILIWETLCNRYIFIEFIMRFEIS